MDCIQSSNKAVDLFGAGKHGFAPGNPDIGLLATIFSAAWANGVQEEILNVIRAAGIAPSGNNLAQLLTALRAAGVFQTAAATDDSTRAATTAWVRRAIDAAIADYANAVGQRDPGTVFFTASATPPPGALKSNGAAVSRTVFARLFARIGTRYGVGDNATTFNLPDARGEFLRALDDGRGADPNRTLGSFQPGTLVGGYDDNTLAGNISLLQNKGIVNYGADPVVAGFYPGVLTCYANVTDTRTVVTSDAGFAVTRPRNVALLACIWY